MSTKRKFKILLIQLPFPHFQIRKHWGNIPLAAGYLKSMAYKEGLLNEVAIEILDGISTNLSSDSRLIDLIVSKSPNILGFSLYNWNSIRSLFIAEKVKKKLSNIKTVVGGPEVTLETKYILDNPVVDIGCFGEGELTFVEIIKSIINGQDDYGNIKGIFYRKDSKIVVTPLRKFLKDLDEIPSPYLLGFINPKDYGEAWLETMRGCQFRCKYCGWRNRPLGSFSVERIVKEIKAIMDKGIYYAHIMNSNFTIAPYFEELCKQIQQINKQKKFSFFAYLWSEQIDEKKADLLQASGCTGANVGLQSSNPITLANMDRKSDLSKFVKGCHLLMERKIHLEIDIIIGLPSDTLKDFKKTSNFIEENKLKDGNMITPFVLFLNPGTALKKEVKKYGIKYHNTPPYLITETDYISKSEIKKAITLVRGKPRPGFSGSLISCGNIEYPLWEKKNLVNFFKIKQLNNHINKVILELDSFCQSIDQLEEVGKKLSRIIFQPFTVWFKTQNIEKDFVLMKSFLSPIAASNPFLLWSIILETDNDFPKPIIERIRKNIFSKEKLFDFCQTSSAISICAIFSWQDNKKTKLQLKDITKSIPFYWSLNISNEPNWRGEISNLFREKHSSGILIDFDPKCKMDFIVNALKFLYKKPKTQRKNILFRNLAINYSKFREQNKKIKDISITKLGYIESILSLDKNMNILSALRPGNESRADLIEYQIRFQKTLKDIARTAKTQNRR